VGSDIKVNTDKCIGVKKKHSKVKAKKNEVSISSTSIKWNIVDTGINNSYDKFTHAFDLTCVAG